MKTQTKTNTQQNNIKGRVTMKHTGISRIIGGLTSFFGCMTAASAAVIVDVDMDIVTPGIQSTRAAAVGDSFTAALVMTVDGLGVSSYGVSVNFDNVELALNGAPATTELLPVGFTFNFTAGVSSESQALGEVRTFEAATLGSGPASTSFTIGTIAYTVTAVSDNGIADIAPGLFNVGIDGIFDNLSGVAPTTFNPGYVIPEPGSATLLMAVVAGLFVARRRRSA